MNHDNQDAQQQVLIEREPATIKTPATTVAQKPRTKTKLISLLALLVLIIAGGLTVAWTYMKPVETPIAAAAETPSSKPIKLTAESITNGAEKLLLSTYAEDSATIKIKRIDEPARALTPEGFDFSVMTKKSPSVVAEYVQSFSSEELRQKQTGDIIETLRTYMESTNLTDAPTQIENNDVYQNDDVICWAASNLQVFPIDLSCANKSDYTEIAAELKPFRTALEKADALKSFDAKNLNLTLISTEASEQTPYERASVSLSSSSEGMTGGLLGLFYREKSAQWNYFTTTQTTLSCAAYNTAELRAAFKGVECTSPSPSANLTTVE